MNRLSIISDRQQATGNKRQAINNLAIGGFFTLLLSLSLSFCLYAKPYHTITVDGDLSDWSEDEALAADSNDSVWIGGNEIEKIYVTWDKNNIYIGLKGQSSSTGLMMYFDFKSGGFSDLTEINTWNRKAVFQNKSIDYFYGSWLQSDGNFYEVITATSASEVSVSKKYSSGWEFAVPFETVYKLGAGRVTPGASVSLFVSLATGDMGSQLIGGTTVNYGYLGGDCVPDNTVNGITVSTITAFLTKVFDADSNGAPDDSYSSSKLAIRGAAVSPSPFSPDGNGYADAAQITFLITKPADVKIAIYDIAGKHVKDICDEYFSGNNLSINKIWDGKNSSGEIAGAGIYFINITAAGSGENKRKNLPVALIK